MQILRDHKKGMNDWICVKPYMRDCFLERQRRDNGLRIWNSTHTIWLLKIQPCSTNFKSAIDGKPRVWAALSCQFTFFLAARPRLLVNLLLLSIEAALRRGDLPFLPPSGFSIHHELFPVPSFCTRTKRLCSDRLCLMEFCRRGGRKRKAGLGANAQRARCLPFSPNHRFALVCECKSMLAGGSHRLKRAIFKVNRKTNAIRWPRGHVRRHALEYYSMGNPF